MSTLRKTIHGLLPVLLILLVAAAVGAQESQTLPGERLAGQNLRPYWYVFAAYTIAIVLVMGWAASIARRLARVEERLGE